MSAQLSGPVTLTHDETHDARRRPRTAIHLRAIHRFRPRSGRRAEPAMRIAIERGNVSNLREDGRPTRRQPGPGGTIWPSWHRCPTCRRASRSPRLRDDVRPDARPACPGSPTSTTARRSSTARSTAMDGDAGQRAPGRRPSTRSSDRVSGFVWIGLHDPSDRPAGRHRRAARAAPAGRRGRASHAHQRPKLERYEDTLFAVVKTVRYDESAGRRTAEVVETGEVMVFLGATS